MRHAFISYCGEYHCGKCAYHRGEFVEPAKRLVDLARRYKSLRLIAGLDQTFVFDEFLKGLEWLASQDEPCKGCRMGGGWSWWPDCPVRTCCIERQVDFCFQCQEFPCKKLKEEPLKERKQRFIEINLQIQQMGLHNWIQQLKKKYNEQEQKSRP